VTHCSDSCDTIQCQQLVVFYLDISAFGSSSEFFGMHPSEFFKNASDLSVCGICRKNVSLIIIKG
jgi:hypothetical protein